MQPNVGQISLFSSRTVATCRVCNRLLTNPKSIAAGIGPVCAGGQAAQTRAAACDGDRERLGDRPYDRVVTSPFLGETIAFGRDHTGVWSNVPHHVFTGKSPDGYEFGYSGSGPAELGINIAQSILIMIEYSGNYSPGRQEYGGGWAFDVAYPIGQEIKFEFLSTADRTAERIEIPTDDLKAFVIRKLDEQEQHEVFID